MNIAIAGYGLEGKSNYKYWDSIMQSAGGDYSITIVDENNITDAPVDAAVISGPGAFGKLNGFDLVVRTAGLSSFKIKTDGRVWSATNEFFEKCPAKIIGVTGSKGKGTTASLIASILKSAGKKVWLVGNIGLPALDILDKVEADDIVVYELSSFQLWDLQRSPQVGVVLYIEPEHLDVHKDLDDYIKAKSNIAINQTTVDRLVYNSNNEFSVSISQKSVGQRLPYPYERGAHVKGDYFYYGDIELCNIDNLLLPGRHNLDNACAAITATWPWVQDGEDIAEGLRGFDGLPHRLKFVREVAGVSYYDDSIATTPGSAIAAIKSFTNPKVLILGGSYKGADFTDLATEIAKTDSKVKSVLLIGDEADRIAEALEAASYTNYKKIIGLEFKEVVKYASSISVSGDVVVLSPACASFGQFKNYVDRGEQFIKAVASLA